jgi:predicted thioesterase
MRRTVTGPDTATSMGSGDVPVLATPRLIAWLEAETVRAAAPLLQPGQTTVGTAIRIQHVAATAVGEIVDLTAAAPIRAAGDERHLSFTVRACDGAGRPVAHGEIDRVIVDRERFLARVAAASGPAAPDR